MKTIFGSRKDHYLTRLGLFLMTVALIAGMAGCDLYTPPSQNLVILTWYDLDAVRNNLTGRHTLMNDLDSTTPGYEELACSTANNGTGWEPIGWGYWASDPPWIRLVGEVFKGSFDGQGHEIRDLFINRSGWGGSGLFGCVGKGGIVRNVGVTNATVTVPEDVDGLVRLNLGTVRTLDVALIDAVGILVGFSMGSVSDSYASGAVSGHWSVGGLVGQNTGTVNNCYSTANVTGLTWGVGGLVGSNGELTYSGTVRNCYSTGSITGDEHVGGLVGKNEDSGAGVNFRGTVRNSFWDTETSGQATSDGGTGKTTAEMKSIATFVEAGWYIIAVGLNETDPAHIWNIVDGVTYPSLSWQP
jgi:The GLUG motif